MFKRMLHAASVQIRPQDVTEETKSGPSTPITTELTKTDFARVVSQKASRFEEIYESSKFKSTLVSTEYNILKVADMLANEQLRGLTPAAKHGALMMAL